MVMKYFNQLSEEEIVELINFCIRLRNQTKVENDSQKEMEIDSVSVLNENDRVDELGNRYARVLTAGREGSLILSCYRVTDFSMKTDDIGISNIDYSGELNKFMFKKFGEDYLRDFYNQRMNQLNQEIEEICSFAYGTRN